jgi:hypothetical protein
MWDRGRQLTLVLEAKRRIDQDQLVFEPTLEVNPGQATTAPRLVQRAPDEHPA